MKLGKMNVYRKAMLMLMSMVLVTFIALGLVSMLGFWGVWRSTGTISEYFDDNVTNYAEEMAIVQTKKLMEENAVEKARQVERELSMVKRDTEFLANSMTRILTHQERYSPRQLFSPLEKRMAAGEAYLLISSAVKDECADEAVQREIALASNAADDLELMASFYNDYQTSCYFGSKYGYYLSLECYDSDAMYNHIHTEAYHNSYDPRNRPWYQVAVAEGKAAFSDVYVGNDGYPEITCAVPYYNMDGFAGVAGLDVHLESLYRLISDRSLGKSNINFALNARGEVVFSSKEDGALAVSDGKHDLRKTAEASLARAAVNMTEGRSDIVMVNLDGSDYYLAYAPLPSVGWSFGTLLKVSEVLEPVAVVRESLSAHPEAFNVSVHSMFLKNVLRNILLVLVILGLFLYGISKAAKGFVQPILALTEGVRIIGKGNLERKLRISTGNEIEEISDSFDSITEKLKGNMERLSKETEEKQKLVTELSIAQGIQESLLQNTLPKSMDHPHCDIFAIKDAAKGDGGSFYEFYNLNENHVAMTIADVSGKGVSALLFMVISQTILKNEVLAAITENTPDLVDWSKVMEQVNRKLWENNEAKLSIAVSFGVLNTVTGKFVYVNCGQNGSLIGRMSERKGQWQYLGDEEKYPKLGVVQETSYAEKHLTIVPGDMLYFCTKGVSEAFDEDGKSDTEDRLRKTLNHVAAQDIHAKDLVSKVREDIGIHVNGYEQSSDITMLCARFLG